MLVPDSVYMDNNATIATSQKVLEAMEELRGLPLNASSIHSLGRKARGLLEVARERIAALTGSGNARIIFTASGTESNNMALGGLAGYKILVSNIEHASIRKTGFQKSEIVVDKDGVVDIAALEELLKGYKGRNFLVSVMLANNETGVIQPVKQIAEIIHTHGGLIHTDAVQCFGKIKVDMADLGVDMLTISAHKFGGPQGSAALIFKKNVKLESIITGGGQEQGYRAGTENVAAIHGFGVAASEAQGLVKGADKIAIIRNKIEVEIKNIAPDAVIFGQDVARLPNTSMIAMPYVPSETQVMHFDMENIAVSAGSACSSGKVEVSHVLLTMGVDAALAKCAIRISLGANNSTEDAEKFVIAWKKLYERAGNKRMLECESVR